MTHLVDNKYSFLKLSPKRPKIFILIIIILILLLLLLIKIKAYDNYETKGYVSCDNICTVVTYIPTDIDYDEIYYKHQIFNYEFLSKEVKVDEENLESYLELRLTSSENLENGEIIHLNFYYKKQRLIFKLLHLMF